MKTWQKLKNDPSLWERYFIRERVIRQTRDYFHSQGFHEVETPLLIGNPPAESYVDVFETTLLTRSRTPIRGYLSTSPEVALKKLLVAGIGNCFSVTKSFRNTELSSNTHTPEFTILEWYRTNENYEAIMADCEKLVLSLVASLHKNKSDSQHISYQGHIIDLTPPWERITVAQSFSRYASIDFNQFLDYQQAISIAQAKGYAVQPSTTWEEIYNQIFLNEVEPHLGKDKPVIIYEFPSSMAALAKHKPEDSRFAQRFEFYIGNLELGDCYSELTDPVEQKARFDREIEEIKRRGTTQYQYDIDFIHALESGMPQSSGVAVGLDRLIMLLSDSASIADTMFFPIGDLFDLS